MALLSKGITFKAGSSTITGLQSIPSLGGSIEKVEVTTLGDASKKYINGLKDYGDLEFKFLYEAGTSDTSNYRTLRAIQDAYTATSDPTACEVALPDGTKFTFNAFLNVSIDSTDVNAAMTFTCSCSLQSEITVTNPQ